MPWHRLTSRRRRQTRERAEEMRAHLEEYADQLVARGLSPETARREARLKFGNPRVKLEEVEAMGRVPLPPVSDFLLGVKLLRSSRELPLMVVALAVGVGLTTACYGLTTAALFTPLPYRLPDELVQVWDVDGTSAERRLLRDGRRERLAAAPALFQGIATYGSLRQSLRTRPDAVPVQVTGAVVSGNLFDVLGVHAIAGRTLRADDGRRTDALPIVVSERLVRAGVLNAGLESAVALDGTPYRLAGVMPDTFWFPDRETSYWLPLPELPPESTAGTATSVTRSSVARLGRGIDPVAAAARANAILSRSDDSPGRRLVAVESYPSLLRAPLRPSLVALQAASGGVLVLVCLNVGWLFGARARRLHQTFATMRALGARPAQVARTYLAAGLCVAAIAAPCAVLTGGVLLRAARTLDTGVFSRMADPTITWHVSAAAVVVTVLVSLVACLPFTWVLARSSHTTRSSGGADRRRGFVASLVLVVQLGLVVAVGGQAVLFGRVLLSFYRTNVGFGNTDFVVVSLRLRPGTPTEPAAQVARHRTLLDDFGRRGIRAAVSNTMPLTQSDLRNDLRPAWMNGLDLGMVRVRVVSPSYFRLTGIEPSSGRLLSAADAGSRRAMVNDTFASAASPPGQSVIGQRHGGQPWRGEFTISGTTPPIRQLDFHEPEQPEIYFLYEDFVSLRPDLASIVASRTYVMAETSGLASTVGTVHEAIGRHLPDMDIRSTSHMRDLIGLRIGPGRLLGAGAAVFAAVALLLVATGLYGVVSHGLALRTREIGLRLALGATPGRVVLESVRPIVLVALTGSVAGALLLWSSWSALQSILIPPAGVAYPSPIGVVGLTTGLLCAAVVAAAWKPVRLAAATDPASALRAE